MNREEAIKTINGEISYDEMDIAIRELGVNALTEQALEILLLYKDSGDEVLFPLLKVLGINAFTDEGLSYIAERKS